MIEALEQRQLLTAAPHVVYSSVHEGSQFPFLAAFITIRFDKTLRPLDSSDFVLTLGDAAGPAVPLTAWSYDAPTDTLSLEYDSAANNAYTLRLISGDGHFEATDGTDLDGDYAAGTLPSGDGTPGGDFTVDFSMTSTAIDAPPPPPRELVANSLSGHEIELSWWVDNQAEYGQVVERSEGDGPFQEIGRLQGGGPGEVVHYDDTTATPGTTYRYRTRIIKYDHQGILFYSDPSNEVVGEVLPPNLCPAGHALGGTTWHPPGLADQCQRHGLLYACHRPGRRHA